MSGQNRSPRIEVINNPADPARQDEAGSATEGSDVY